MALPELPPPLEIPAETKRAVIDGMKQVLAALQAKGLFDAEITHSQILHDPELLYGFIQTYRKNEQIGTGIVVDKTGRQVTEIDKPLVCGVTLGQIQQLMVKTCARYFLEQDASDSEEIVTKTVTKKTMLFFTKTEKVQRKIGGVDPRVLREALRFIAFDWQMPLLGAYTELSLAQLLQLGENILALRTPESVREIARFDAAALKRARDVAQEDFVAMLEKRPAAITGLLHWPRDQYVFYRDLLGDKAYDFFARDNRYFMLVAALDRATARIYGDILAYMSTESLEELQRLNIDKVDVLVNAMRAAFGPKLPELLSRPGFTKEFLRKLVEGLLHMTQDKTRIATSALMTCKALVPQVTEWLGRQRSAA